MSNEEPTVNFENVDSRSIRATALFEEEQHAWETLLAVTLEIKESVNEINRKLDDHEQSVLRADP